MEPGLNQAALSRLMGLSNLLNFDDFKEEDALGLVSDNLTTTQLDVISEAAPAEHNNHLSKVSNAQCRTNSSNAEQKRKWRAERLEKQRRDNKYHRFVDENLILKSGLIDKK